MRLFCLKLGGFVLLQAAIFFGLVWDPGFPHETGYLAATIEKHQRLNRAQPPRIILIGSSSFAFGVRSDWLEEEFNRPVINMGMDGSLGLDFILNEIKSSVRTGDCVILSFESVLFTGGMKKLKQRQILEYRPASLAYVAPDVRRKLLDEHAFALLSAWTRRSLSIPFPRLPARQGGLMYSRGGFNAWGDYVAHRSSSANMALTIIQEAEGELPPDDGWGAVHAVSPNLHSRVESFSHCCSKLGATFVFTWTPQPAQYLEQHRGVVKRAVEFVKSVPGLEMLDSPEDHVYELSLFFDTKQHLTGAGAELRTAKLIDELRPLFAQERR